MKAGVSTFTRAAGLGLAALLVSGEIHAQDLIEGRTLLIPREVDAMYVKGLEFLKKAQTDTGTFSAQGGRSDHYGSQPAVVGLGVVAMLAHGDDPNGGPYALAIRRGLNFILKSQNSDTGYIGSSMYNHGFATLALAEAYGAVNDPRLGPALKNAVKLIFNAQKRSSRGGWRYSPTSTDADTTVSGANLMALYAARKAGIGVPNESVNRALRFYVACQGADGGFGYTSAGGSNGPRTAIAVLMFALAKKKNTEQYQRGLQYLVSKDPSGGYSHYYHYYLYYAAQTFFHSGPRVWHEWNAENIRRLSESQSDDGSWTGNFGPTFATTCSLLSLALNYRYLPIYER